MPYYMYSSVKRNEKRKSWLFLLVQTIAMQENTHIRAICCGAPNKKGGREGGKRRGD